MSRVTIDVKKWDAHRRFTAGRKTTYQFLADYDSRNGNKTHLYALAYSKLRDKMDFIHDNLRGRERRLALRKTLKQIGVDLRFKNV